MKLYKKVIAIIMTVVMLISMYTFVFPIFAEELNDFPMNESLMEQEKPEPEILDEVIDKRDEYTKHFYMSDGTFLATEYTLPVHFKTESGDWVEYDNTLEQQGDEDTGVYTTVLSNHPTSLAIKAASDRTASIDDSEYPISWGYEGAKSSKLRIDDKNVHMQGNEKYTSLEKISTKAEYKNIFPHVDLQYIVDSKGVKENLVLKNKNASGEYVVNYRIGGLAPHQVDEKKIELQNERGETVYVITAPTMYDQNGQYSDMLTLNMLSNENGTLSVHLSVDSTWLKDKDREYPVVIDPTIIVNRDSNVVGTYVSSAQPSISFGNSESIVVSSGSSTSYGLIKEDISVIDLQHYHIVSAIINLPISENNGAMILKAYESNDEWDECLVNWYTKPSVSSTVLDYAKITSSSERAVFDITKLYKEAALTIESETASIEKSVMIKTDDPNSISLLKEDTTQPIRTIKYISAMGLDESYKYSDFEMGSAGTIHVNNLTGNLVFERDDISFGSSDNPYEFSAVYNSLYVPMDGSDNTNNQDLSNGWMYSPFAGFKMLMIHLAEDGAVESFKRTSVPDEENTYTLEKNEYGWEKIKATGFFSIPLPPSPFPSSTTTLQLPIQFDAWKANGTEKYSFDLDGLVQKEVNGKTVLTRQELSIDGQPVFEYVDDEGNKIQFQADETESRLTKYTKKGNTFILSDIVRYIKDANGQVVSIQKNGKQQASITYTGDRITSISNNEDYTLMFDYQENTKRITAVEECLDSTSGRKVTFSRTGDSVTVRSSGADCIYDTLDDVLTTYSYDNYAKVTGEKSETVQGEELGGMFYQYIDENGTDEENGDNNAYSSFQTTLSKTSLNGKNAVNLVENHNLESAAEWSTKTIDDSSCSYSSGLSTNAYAGTKSFQLTINSITKTGGAGYYQPFYISDGAVQVGKTYTASAYINTSGFTRSSVADASRNYGASVMIRFTKSDGSTARTYSENIQKTDSAINGGWERAWVSFTIPADTTRIAMYLLARNGTGTVLFDCAQLEEGNIPSQYNLLQNNGFVYKTNNSPDGWTRYNLDSTDYATNDNQMMIHGSPSVKKGLYQNVTLSNASQDDTYIVSGWATADSVPRSSGANYLVYATVYFNSSGSTISEQKVLSEFNYFYSGKQYTCSAFDLSSSEDPDAIPTSIRIVMCYYYEANTALFDSVNLVRSNEVNDFKKESKEYTYDSLGRIETYTDSAGTVYYYSYYSNGNLKSKLTSEGVGQHYANRDEETLTKEVFEDGSYVEYLYYSNWSLCQKTQKNADNSIITQVTYSLDGKISFERMENGSVYYYSYDQLGNLVSRQTIDNEGDTFSYYYYDKDNDGINETSVPNTELYEDGTQHIYTYYSDWSLCSETEMDANNNIITSTTYSTDGTIQSEQNESGAVYYYTYDSMGNTLSKLTLDNRGDRYYYHYYDFNEDGVDESSKVYFEEYENGDWIFYDYNDEVLTKKYESKNGKQRVIFYDIKGNTTSVQHNGFNYNYTYDVFGKPTSVKIGSQPIVTYSYRANNGSLQSATFGNGSTESYTYNEFGELKSRVLSGLGTFEYRYDSQGNPIYEEDSVNNQKTFFQVDDRGRYVGENVYIKTLTNAHANELYSYITVPDDEGRAVKKEVTANGTTVSIPYTYTELSNGNKTAKATWAGIRATTITSDSQGRMISRSLSSDSPATETFAYDDEEKLTTYTTGNDTYTYTYDANGNVLQAKKNNVLRQSYEYDADGQLTRENNLDTNRTIVYTYDDGGNITQKKEYAYTTGTPGTVVNTINYSYDSIWCDKLTNYNGQSISYDAIGNPTTYRGATTTWFGRQMQSYSKGNTSVSYKYDSDGLRTQKTVNGTVYDYYYVDGRLVYEKRGDTLAFFYCYDADGNIALIRRVILSSGAVGNFYTILNDKGDVVGLRNYVGTVLARYNYDSWGKLMSITDGNGTALADGSFAHQMAFRYRGYYYDTETGLYYLQSRYYDPDTGRFINADSDKYIGKTEAVNTYNAFVYCDNDSINESDPTGYDLYHQVYSMYSGPYGFLGLGFYNPSAGNIFELFLDPWSTKKWCIQKLLGYTDLYDQMAWVMGCYIHCAKSEFYYQGKYWRIELWMGRYGISIGGEIGVYEKDNPTILNFYDCSSAYWKMSFTIYGYNKGKNTKILKMNSRGPGEWWLTGFKYNTNIKDYPPYPMNLTMNATIDFKDSIMAKLFIKRLRAFGWTTTKIKASRTRTVVKIQWTSRTGRWNGYFKGAY